MNEIITFLFQVFIVGSVVISLGYALLEFLMEAVDDWRTERADSRRWKEKS